MKCGQLEQGRLADAYRKALEVSEGQDVTIETLAPYLKETGSSCGACPALLPLARRAFENEAANQPKIVSMVRDDISEILPGLSAFKLDGA